MKSLKASKMKNYWYYFKKEFKKEITENFTVNYIIRSGFYLVGLFLFTFSFTALVWDTATVNTEPYLLVFVPLGLIIMQKSNFKF